MEDPKMARRRGRRLLRWVGAALILVAALALLYRKEFTQLWKKPETKLMILRNYRLKIILP